MATRLFDALSRVDGKDLGAVFIDGHKAYRFWPEPEGTVNFEMTRISDVAIVDQEVQFDYRGAAQVSDTNGQLREVRILVMVPFGPLIQASDLIYSPEGDAD